MDIEENCTRLCSSRQLCSKFAPYLSEEISWTCEGARFLIHGALATPADYLILGPNITLAYCLSDHGCDVW